MAFVESLPGSGQAAYDGRVPCLRLAGQRGCVSTGGWGGAACRKLKHKETVVEGIDHAADAFLGLFKGSNIRKMEVKLGT